MKTIEVQKGKLIREFKAKREYPLGAVLTNLITMLFFYGMAIFLVMDSAHWSLILPFATFGVLGSYATYCLATRHLRPLVRVYEGGCEFFYYSVLPSIPKKCKWALWNEILSVEQIPYIDNRSPTFSFVPGYWLQIDSEKPFRVSPTMDGYVEFYRNLFLKGVSGSDNPLYLFETDNLGRQLSSEKGWYSAVYYPKSDETKKLRGRPVVIEPIG